MGDPPRKKPPSPLIVVEENVAPPRVEKLLVAQQVPRMRTPIGMPAPPAPPVEPPERESYDDLEHIATVDRLERSRAELLAKLQDKDNQLEDKETENRKLRQRVPTFSFPPSSISPPELEKKKPSVEVAPTPQHSDRILIGQRLTRLATGIGVFVAISWNAFNSFRGTPEKVEAVQNRLNQSEQQRTEEITARVLKDQREAQRWRAVACWAKQLRGASQRQGLDLPSLPGGGVKALRLDQGDPSKAPFFVAEEKCPDFPPLPPDTAAP